MKREIILEKIENSRYLMKDWFLSDCEKYGNNVVASLSADWNTDIFFNDKSYIWILAAFEKDENAALTDQMDLFFSVCEALEKRRISVEAFLEKNIFSFFLAYDGSEKQTADKAFATAEIIQGVINKHRTPDYGIGIGKVMKNLSRVREAYTLAREASNYRYSMGTGRIIYIADVEPDMRVNDYHTLREADFRTSLKIGSEQMNYEVVSDIFGHIKRNNDPLDIAKRISLELLVSANRAIYELGKDPSILFDKTDIWSIINRCSDVEQLHQLILNASQLVIMRIFKKHVSKDKTIVDKAKRIIDEDAGSRICLETVAQRIYISPCYLSTVFSRETGMTFKDYLINSRISRAKGLLHDPAIKIYNVAKAVGYSDSRYFSDLFKKKVGMTPAEYRKNLLMKI